MRLQHAHAFKHNLYISSFISVGVWMQEASSRPVYNCEVKAALPSSLCVYKNQHGNTTRSLSKISIGCNPLCKAKTRLETMVNISLGSRQQILI